MLLIKPHLISNHNPNTRPVAAPREAPSVPFKRRRPPSTDYRLHTVLRSAPNHKHVLSTKTYYRTVDQILHRTLII